jgi:hypothetical protein
MKEKSLVPLLSILALSLSLAILIEVAELIAFGAISIGFTTVIFRRMEED